MQILGLIVRKYNNAFLVRNSTQFLTLRSRWNYGLFNLVIVLWQKVLKGWLRWSRGGERVYKYLPICQKYHSYYMHRLTLNFYIFDQIVIYGIQSNISSYSFSQMKECSYL